MMLWALALLAAPMGGGSAASEAPRPDTPSLFTYMPPGSTLDLALPRALPCRQFQTASLQMSAGPGQPVYEGQASIAWDVAGREQRIAVNLLHPLPSPLAERELPRKIKLVASAPVVELNLSFHCRQSARTMYDEALREAEPFVGVRWSCKPGGCRATVGYPLAAGTAVSPRRLRLCAKAGGKRLHDWCDAAHRDIRPAFDDQGRALALALEIMADAQRTLTDACAAVHGCSPIQRTLARSMRPGRWRVTSFKGQRDDKSRPDEMTLKGQADDRMLVLDCFVATDASGSRVSCELKALGSGGQPLFTYVPIHDWSVTNAELDFERSGHITLEAPRKSDTPSGCSVGGELLPTR